MVKFKLYRQVLTVRNKLLISERRRKRYRILHSSNSFSVGAVVSRSRTKKIPRRDDLKNDTADM
jgi:hypothetical protein